MDEFPYYALSWFIYLLFTAVFLLFCTWHSRKWSIWARIPVLTFIAALALTPGITISGESWWSPAAIIMIFELDSKGLSGIWKGLLSIIAFWIVLMISTFIVNWRLGKSKRFGSRKSKVNSADSDDALSEENSSKYNDPEQRDIDLLEPDN